MQITSFNVHGITEVVAERESSNGTLWTRFKFLGPDGEALVVTAFAPEGYVKVAGETHDALRDLVDRCDGEAGVRADGSNIDTIRAHAALGDFDEPEDDPEPDEIEPVGRYEESASYRADMINAGRGHLLGD